MKGKRNEKEENTRSQSTVGASSVEICFVTSFSSDAVITSSNEKWDSCFGSVLYEGETRLVSFWDFHIIVADGWQIKIVFRKTSRWEISPIHCVHSFGY